MKLSVRIRPAQPRAITWSIVLILGIQSAWPVGHAAVRLATLQPSQDLAVTKQLRDEEINPGDKVALVNSALLDHLLGAPRWSFCSARGLRRFTVLELASSTKIKSDFQADSIWRQGHRGARHPEFKTSGWQRVPNTNHYVLIPSK
jgi:hypothetical protein